MNWKHAILPLIILLLYISNALIISTQLESPLAKNIEKQTIRPSVFLNIWLGIISPAIESLTFGQKSCIVSYEIAPCKVHSSALFTASQEYSAEIRGLPQSAKPYHHFEYASEYTIFDYAQQIITLLIEALLVSLLIGVVIGKLKK